MSAKIFGTPEPSLSVELRKVLDKENILTSKTRKKVVDALDDYITNDQDRKMALMRKKIVDEIYLSEEKYINRLSMILNFFKNPIAESKLAPASVVNLLFGNIDSINGVNRGFLVRLKENKERIVSTFLETAPFFKVYSVYAYGYKNIISMLESMPKANAPLYDFICKQETRPEVGIKLSSLLISPVQRIPRYLLLLKELKSFTPESSSTYAELEDAVTEISLIVDHIEGLLKEQENISRMIKIQRCLLNGKPNIVVPGRKLLKEGKLYKMVKTDIWPRYIILLSDIILYCKDWNGSSLKCLRVLPIDKCIINAIGFKKGVFALQCQSFSVVLCSKDNQQVTHEWVEAIQNAASEFMNNKKSLRRLSSHRKPLQRKEFKQLEDPNGIFQRKRQATKSEEIDVCISSPWKKIKTCSSDIEGIEEKSLRKKEIEADVPTTEVSMSYVKLAKQFISSMKHTTQKLINETDPANCLTLSSKLASVTDNKEGRNIG